MKRFLDDYRKVFGIFGLLLAICIYISWRRPDAFLTSENLQNLIRWTALSGIIGIGVSFVIMTGGIDLSIGSKIALVGVLLAMWLQPTYTPPDAFNVVGADREAKTIQVEQGPTPFESGDHVAFLGAVYEVAGADGDTIKTADDLGPGSKGKLQRAWIVSDVSAEQDTEVRVGDRVMHLRTVKLASAPSGRYRKGDRLTLLPPVGNSQDFVIHSIEPEGTDLTIDFQVRPRERVHESPVGALLAERSQPMSSWMAVTLVLLVATGLGLVHGLLITQLKLQPFIVTLCGLLIYRGVARYITGDQQQGFGDEYPNLKLLANGNLIETLTGTQSAYDVPLPFVLMIVIAIVAAAFLNQTIYGRYILALGRNEEAARYSGINTERMTILAYMICGLCSGIAGVLFSLHINSVQPSQFGNFYELYAIAAAVLGGCSLRGGEGTIIGVVIAAAVIQVLRNTINLDPLIPLSMEFGIIGFVILAGVTVDELFRRWSLQRKK